MSMPNIDDLFPGSDWPQFNLKDGCDKARAAIAEYYDSCQYAWKLVSMPDAQVWAMYYKLKYAGKIV